MRRTTRTLVERCGIALGAFLTPLPLYAATYYVAPTGSDAAAGTMAAPWVSFAHAQQIAVAGDTVFFRAGRYAFTAGLTACTSQTATINAILLNKSGTANGRIAYWAFPGETPIFDFSGIRDSCRITGIRITGSFIHLKGLEVMGVPQNNNLNHESWGVWDSGSNNIFELLNTHNNAGPGLFIQDGSNNLVQNCDSHDNFDAMSSTGPGTNADGFGCHIGDTGTGNMFRGCRAWFNADDGYDLINARVPVIIENSWAWNNGYLSGTTTASGGDGNGFKGGGFGDPAVNPPASPPHHTVRECVSFLNRANGFYANHEPVPNMWFNNTAFNNRSSNFNMLGLVGTTDVNLGMLRNNIAFTGTALANGTGAMVDDAFNTFTAGIGVTVTAADFQSTSTTGWDVARQADGSLPVVTSLHLAAGSDLIDKGTNVNLPFTGAAPDLGAFEVGLAEGPGGVDAGMPTTGAGGAAGTGGAGGTGGVRDAGTTGAGGANGRDASVDAGRTIDAGGAGTGAGGSTSSGAGGTTGAGGSTTGAGGSGGATTGSGGSGTSLGGGAGQSVTTSAGGSTGTTGLGGSAPGSGVGGSNAPGADGGCSCRMTSRGDVESALGWFSLLGLVAWRRRRRAS